MTLLALIILALLGIVTTLVVMISRTYILYLLLKASITEKQAGSFCFVN